MQHMSSLSRTCRGAAPALPPAQWAPGCGNSLTASVWQQWGRTAGRSSARSKQQTHSSCFLNSSSYDPAFTGSDSCADRHSCSRAPAKHFAQQGCDLHVTAESLCSVHSKQGQHRQAHHVRCSTHAAPNPQVHCLRDLAAPAQNYAPQIASNAAYLRQQGRLGPSEAVDALGI